MIAVHNELRSIIQTYGTELTQRPKLCDAYLSDLLADYPEQRKVLVVAVKSKITSKILNKSTISKSEKSHSRFASKQQRKWAIDTWYYALQGKHRLGSQFSLIGRNKFWILSAFIGLLVIGTLWGLNSNSFLKTNEAGNQHSEKTVQINENTATPVKTTLIPSNAQPDASPYLEPHTIKPAEEAKANIAKKTPLKTVKSTDTQENEKAISLKNKQKNKVLPQTKATTKSSTRKNTKNKIAPHKKTPRDNPKNNALQQKQQAHATTIQKNKLAQREAILVIQDALVSSVALHRETMFVEKKKHDIQELMKLFKLTRDSYYQQQINRARQKLSTLNKNRNHLSSEYKTKLRTICYIQPWITKKALQEIRSNKKQQTAINRAAIFRLIQHLKSCR